MWFSNRTNQVMGSESSKLFQSQLSSCANASGMPPSRKPSSESHPGGMQALWPGHAKPLTLVT